MTQGVVLDAHRGVCKFVRFLCLKKTKKTQLLRKRFKILQAVESHAELYINRCHGSDGGNTETEFQSIAPPEGTAERI